MKVVRILLGVFGCLMALFAGGCGFIFLGAQPSLPMALVATLFGFLPAGLGALLASWAFSSRGFEFLDRMAALGFIRLVGSIIGVVILAITLVPFIGLGLAMFHPDGPRINLTEQLVGIFIPSLIGGAILWVSLKWRR